MVNESLHHSKVYKMAPGFTPHPQHSLVTRKKKLWVTEWHKQHPNFSPTILGFWFQVLSMAGNFHGAVLAT